MDRFVDISGVENSFKGGNHPGVDGYILPEVTIIGDKPNAQTGKKIGQYLTPENVAAAGQIAAGVFQSLGKTEQQKLIKQACGRRPLIGKQRKAAYQQCVANLMAGSSRETVPPPSEPTGLNQTTKIILFSVIGLIIIGLIVFLIIKTKKN